MSINRAPQTTRPRLVDVQAGHAFASVGRVCLPGVLGGRHRL